MRLWPRSLHRSNSNASNDGQIRGAAFHGQSRKQESKRRPAFRSDEHGAVSCAFGRQDRSTSDIEAASACRKAQQQIRCGACVYQFQVTSWQDMRAKHGLSEHCPVTHATTRAGWWGLPKRAEYSQLNRGVPLTRKRVPVEDNRWFRGSIHPVGLL